ncbi:hypothetical protein GN956_G1509 [Arapaima gigas]
MVPALFCLRPCWTQAQHYSSYIKYKEEFTLERSFEKTEVLLNSCCIHRPTSCFNGHWSSKILHLYCFL